MMKIYKIFEYIPGMGISFQDALVHECEFSKDEFNEIVAEAIYETKEGNRVNVPGALTYLLKEYGFKTAHVEQICMVDQYMSEEELHSKESIFKVLMDHVNRRGIL